MSTMPMSEVLLHLRSVVLPDGGDLTDGQLLECFVNRRQPPALEALVRRHAPMVWGVCRRVLGNHHDAEDAFQATFLVLVRKGASVHPREKIGNWLYGVAHQTALKARASRARRQERERPVPEMPEPAVKEPEHWQDMQEVVDREVSRLPQKYRTVIVLCELEGRSVREAARQLGCPEGTVASRLARARAMLARRLSRHGPGVPGAMLAAVLPPRGASVSVPPSVLSATIKATISVAGEPAATVAVSGAVAALTEGVMKGMLFTKLRAPIAIVLILGFVATGTTILTCRTASGQRDDRKPVGEKQVHVAGPGGETALGFDPGLDVKAPVGAREKGWALDFQYRNPRFIRVNVPGAGPRTVLYLWCKVANQTGKTVNLAPGFELATDAGKTDRGKKAPAAVLEAIQGVEDPTGYQRLVDFAAIQRQLLPPAKAGPARLGQANILGVVTWDDTVNNDTKTLSVFVSGLSSERRSDEKKGVLLKTLKLTFRREADRFGVAQEFRFVAQEWVYRPAAGADAGPPAISRAHVAKPLGRILAIIHRGDKVYIDLGTADDVRPKMKLVVYGAGSYNADHSPKASLEVLSITSAHLSLARVTWLHDPDRQPLVRGDELYHPAKPAGPPEEAQARIAALLKEVNALRDRAVAAEIMAKAQQDRAGALEHQLEELVRELARLQKGKEAGARGK
jgi:RNA polymerase sigma factor (sigma-70 family)